MQTGAEQDELRKISVHAIKLLSRPFTGAIEDYMKRFFYAGPALRHDPARRLRGVGLVLVALGVFSVVAYTVSRQTHEIGIRMALPRSTDVLGMVMRMGLRLLAGSE